MILLCYSKLWIAALTSSARNDEKGGFARLILLNFDYYLKPRPKSFQQLHCKIIRQNYYLKPRLEVQQN
jgi:hypothetical protein